MTRLLTIGIAAIATAAPFVVPTSSFSAERRKPAEIVVVGSKAKKDTVKQGTQRRFNPKELSVDQSVPWKKAPKAKTLCAPPGGGKPRAC